MVLDDITSRVVRRLTDGEADRSRELESLVDWLLSTFVGWRPRLTDGLVILREEVAADAYFAVGTLHVVDDQSRHAVAIELAWSATGGPLDTGVVRVGVNDSRAKYRQYDNVEKALLASPREAAAEFSWQHSFGWARSQWHNQRAIDRRF